jgi:hypothetical protein
MARLEVKDPANSAILSEVVDHEDLRPEACTLLKWPKRKTTGEDVGRQGLAPRRLPHRGSPDTTLPEADFVTPRAP